MGGFGSRGGLRLMVPLKKETDETRGISVTRVGESAKTYVQNRSTKEPTSSTMKSADAHAPGGSDSDSR